MKRIAVSTGGGDAPGLNAVIRAVVKTAINEFDCQVLGVRDGLDGFLEEDGVIPLDFASVRGILPRGGTNCAARTHRSPPAASHCYVVPDASVPAARRRKAGADTEKEDP